MHNVTAAASTFPASVVLRAGNVARWRQPPGRTSGGRLRLAPGEGIGLDAPIIPVSPPS